MTNGFINSQGVFVVVNKAKTLTKKPEAIPWLYSPEEKAYNLRITDLYSKPKYDSTSNRQVLPGLIGLEIECEGMNLYNTPIKWWSCHKDDSLRAFKGSPPTEYVLRKPVTRDDFSKAVDYLVHKLKLQGSYVWLDSPRTSLHVHLNCQPLTMKQVMTFVCLYMLVEEFLVEFSGPKRIGNLFCLRTMDAQHFFRALERAVLTEDYSELSNDEFRYASCNLAALSKYGSLEFRSMRCTVDKTEIELWVDLLLSIKDQAAMLSSPVDIVSLFNSDGPEGLLRFIFPKDEHYALFCNHEQLKSRIWTGIRMVKELAFACTWDEPLPFEPEKLKEPKKKPSKKKVKVMYDIETTTTDPHFGVLPIYPEWSTFDEPE